MAPPPKNLWVGNLAPDNPTDADLTANNQESFFHGNPLRIDFANPEQDPEFWGMRDGQYSNRSIGHLTLSLCLKILS
ncbi:hypothetical protein HAX54_030147 [Datura stramonium]|uniref:Uncharacterized protein n=1 Tax=Datura stramonium TaxID=4076 RepID=A0ABS8Y915_DATST|nr:hypothetical protein [Datura stramonium]